MSLIQSRIQMVVFVAIFSFASITIRSFTPFASAQTAVTGGLNGVVTDSTGAVVPGAKVTIVNTATELSLIHI